MLVATLVAFGAATAPVAASQPDFAAEACVWLRNTTAGFDVQCPPSPALAVVADAFGKGSPVLALVVTSKKTQWAGLVVVSRRYDLPDSAYTRGWHVILLREWDSGTAVPAKVEVLPKGHFERVPPFARGLEPREVEEIDTPGQAILVSLADRRRWVFAPIQDRWRMVYLGIPHPER